jgi:uncharacterized protein (TIRG00374 family)
MRKIVSILVSLCLLVLIYRKIDLAAVLEALRSSKLSLFLWSTALTAPVIWLQAVRLRQLAGPQAPFSTGEGVRLVLAACVLNLALPSKMGDLAKAIWMRDGERIPMTRAFSLVLVERICDLLAMCALGVAGFFFLSYVGPVQIAFAAVSLLLVLLLLLVLMIRHPVEWALVALETAAPRQFREKIRHFHIAWSDLRTSLVQARGGLATALLMSVVIWFFHLLQIFGFALSIDSDLSFLPTVALNIDAVLSGLAPLTFAGIGVRDGALVILYEGILSPAGAAALGIFMTSRYAVPALAGLPFVHRYLSAAKERKRTTESDLAGS